MIHHTHRLLAGFWDKLRGVCVHIVPANFVPTTENPEEDWELVSCLGSSRSMDVQLKAVLASIEDRADQWIGEQLANSLSWDGVLHAGGEDELGATDYG